VTLKSDFKTSEFLIKISVGFISSLIEKLCNRDDIQDTVSMHSFMKDMQCHSQVSNNEKMDNNSSSILDSEQRVFNQLNQLNQDMSKNLHQSSCNLSLSNSKGNTVQDFDSGKDSTSHLTYK
jgi:hypothetical protein